MRILLSLLALCILALPLHAQENEAAAEPAPAAEEVDPNAMTLDGLLEAVQAGRLAEDQANRERIRRFRNEQGNRQQMLDDILAEEQRQEAISKARETQFENNEKEIGELEERLKERMGSLKELFGVLQQVSSDAQAQFHVSLTQLERPDRTDFLVDFRRAHGPGQPPAGVGRKSSDSGTNCSGRWWNPAASLPATQAVVDSPGQRTGDNEVTRVGLFNVVSDGVFLQHIPGNGTAAGIRPPARLALYLQGTALHLAAGETGSVPLCRRPGAGASYWCMLTQAPNLRERIDQGGVIGYLIITLGASSAYCSAVCPLRVR